MSKDPPCGVLLLRPVDLLGVGSTVTLQAIKRCVLTQLRVCRTRWPGSVTIDPSDKATRPSKFFAAFSGSGNTSMMGHSDYPDTD